MKYSIFLLAVFSIYTSSMLTSCDSPAKKVDNAQENLTVAKEELAKAKQDYLLDIENYKRQNAEMIAANNKSIAEFNAKTEREKKEVKADYKIKIAELEKKNSDMQKKLDSYKTDNQDQWENFKAEFSRDMDKLGLALKDLTVKNN
jgi:DNA anti-recombination protein RmuC